MVYVDGLLLYTVGTSQAQIVFEMREKIGCQDREILDPGK
jgi:hypothetical protein